MGTLKAYTHHTNYDVRDFGKNSVDSTFPVSLAGQGEGDCGVYALAAAWEVSRPRSRIGSQRRVSPST
jgi:hypothetical protein